MSRAPDDEHRPAGISRRTLIRLLVGLGIGVPIVLEGLTLAGLIGNQLDDGDPGTGTPTPTPTGVGVGDELLVETSQTDRLESAYISADGWTFTMTVAVENTGERTYELRLGTVTTEDGRTVEGGGESDPIPPGESGSVVGRWDLPDGADPASVDVVAISRNGTVTKVERTVQLGTVTVRGG